MVRKKGVLLNIDYILRKGQTYARLEVKGRRASALYYKYNPYFYAYAPPEARKEIEGTIAKARDGEIVSPKKVEPVKRTLNGETRQMLKIYCKAPRDVPLLEDKIEFACYEYSIPFGRRFLMDLGLVPLSIIKYEREGRFIKKFLGSEGNGGHLLQGLSFDIETYNPEGASRESKDPALMVSYATDDEGGVLTYKDVPGKEFVHTLDGEKEMIEGFCSLLEEKDVDVLMAYNSTNFDLPYLLERAKRNKIELPLSRDGSSYRKTKKGLLNPLKIRGRVHIDLYPSVRFFGFTGMIQSGDYTLKNVYSAITGKKKKMVERSDIWKMWDNGELGELSEYSLADAVCTHEIGKHLLPIQMELSEITRLPLFDVAYSTSGQLVESLLMSEAVEKNIVIPPKPSGSAVNARAKNPIKGAYVKLPEPGIYDDIVVFDFRGLYPSIICSYNIDPDRLDREGDSFESPTGAKFLKEPVGLIPGVLERLMGRRAKIKKRLKEMEKGSAAYNQAYARSYALKILANSFYGYLGYARSRWYNRNCAESVTSWGRQHIKELEKKAEKAGFRVLYMDTDSVFLLLGDRTKEEALEFLEEINSELPEKMELELEDFYSRGVFVSKKHQKEATGAKKKYAMLSEDGSIKIKGFELVRRDWSAVARETQRKVLEAILKEGRKQKAVEIVKEVIEELKKGKMPMEKVSIYTQLKKDPKNYDIKSPELSAAQKAMERGRKIGRGSIISYVITQKGKSISDKAELAEFAENYDPQYYIDNQVLPSVMKILKELGYDEYELKHGGKQKGLGDWF
ncbi:MAG: DNA-directed DNA polymerase [Candidatus Micrarchaeia archaeon]